jgi:hypothetical protein
MYEDNGFALALVNIVQLHPAIDVIVRGKGPGPRPRLVFDLDHTALRCCERLTADTPDGGIPHFYRRFCRAIPHRPAASDGQDFYTCRTP